MRLERIALLVLYKLVDDITDMKKRKRLSGRVKLYMIHILDPWSDTLSFTQSIYPPPATSTTDQLCT